MSNSFLQNPKLIKGASAFAISSVADRLILKNDNMMQNATFGAAVAGGIIGGQILGDQIPAMLPDSAGLYQGKLVVQRVVEIGTGSVAAYLLNSVVFKNDFNKGAYLYKFGVIIAADVVSEYITDYVLGTSLGYLVD